MKHSEIQYVIARDLLNHIQFKLQYGKKYEAAERIRELSIPLLDTLADDLNNPEIAKLWDDPVLAENYKNHDRKNRTGFTKK